MLSVDLEKIVLPIVKFNDQTKFRATAHLMVNFQSVVRNRSQDMS